MRTLAWKVLREYIEAGHQDARKDLKDWFDTVERADWARFADVRNSFRSADGIGDKLIFNIVGNRYRLIVRVDYSIRRMWIRWIGTHAEYDRLSRRDIEDL